MTEITKIGRDVIKIGDKQGYIDGILRQNMDDMKADVRKDDDVVIIVDGKERIGKSVLAQTMGWYLSDGKLSLQDVCLTPEEFTARILSAKKYEVIIFDECFLGLAATNWQQNYNRLIKKMLVTVGQKNLILIMVLPSIFDLDKYVALHRADCLVHAFKNKGVRGFFSFYSHRNTQKLYILGKKIYSYYRPKCNFYGKFTNNYFVDEAEYRKKKKKSLNDLLTNKDEDVDQSRLSKQHLTLYKALHLLNKVTDLSIPQISKEINFSERQIKRALQYMRSKDPYYNKPGVQSDVITV